MLDIRECKRLTKEDIFISVLDTTPVEHSGSFFIIFCFLISHTSEARIAFSFKGANEEKLGYFIYCGNLNGNEIAARSILMQQALEQKKKFNI